jgi:uncharacterized damage-inducible protein DinB
MDLRYPIGPYTPPPMITPADRSAWIAELESLPANLRQAVDGLTDPQLDTPYRPAGWTLRQVVHHLADGHMNSYTRFRLALTEPTPTVKPFDENAWAELPDAKSGPLEPSLALIDALHRRWVTMLRSLSDDDFKRTYRHPDRSEPTVLDHTLGYFAWHGRHHVAQILTLRKHRGW